MHLLHGQLRVGVLGAAAGHFAGGAQFVGGSPGECFHPDLRQLFVRGAQVFAGVATTTRAAQPLAVAQVRPREVRRQRRLCQLRERLQMVVLGIADQRPRSRRYSAGESGAGGSGALEQRVQCVPRDLVRITSDGGLHQFGQGEAGQEQIATRDRVPGGVEGRRVLTEAVVQHGHRPMGVRGELAGPSIHHLAVQIEHLPAAAPQGRQMHFRIQLRHIAGGVGDRLLLGDRGHRLPEIPDEHRGQGRLGEPEPDGHRRSGVASGPHQPVDDRRVQLQIPQLTRENRCQRGEASPPGILALENPSECRHTGVMSLVVQQHQRIE